MYYYFYLDYFTNNALTSNNLLINLFLQGLILQIKTNIAYSISLNLTIKDLFCLAINVKAKAKSKIFFLNF
jgi:hypothetical protein